MNILCIQLVFSFQTLVMRIQSVQPLFVSVELNGDHKTAYKD